MTGTVSAVRCMLYFKADGLWTCYRNVCNHNTEIVMVCVHYLIHLGNMCTYHYEMS